MKKEKILILDADNTILNSMIQIYESVCTVFGSVDIMPPSLEEYSLTFSFPFGPWYRGRGVNLSDEEIYRRYLKAYKEQNGEYNPLFFQDALEMIHRLHSENYRFKIVTANSADNIVRVLKTHGLEKLIECKSAYNKVEAIREYVRMSFYGPKTFYVCDAICDVPEAIEAGAFPVVVLRGPMERHAIKYFKIGAKRCVTSLTQIIPEVLGQ